MNVNKITTTTSPLDLVYASKLSSEKLNAFSEATANDLVNISNYINNVVSPIISTLSNDFAIGSSKLDGKSILLDSSATSASDMGLFYYNGKPISIYNAFIVFLQLIANIDNGLKDGIRIGDKSSLVEFVGGTAKSYDWIYSDGMFLPRMFSYSASSGVEDVTELFSFVCKDNKINITLRSDISSKQVYGFVWHPVFAF